MKLIRARNPVAIDLIKDKINADDGGNAEVEAEALKAGLTKFPDKLFILIAFEGEEIKAFAVVTDVDNSNYVFIHYAWCDPKAETTLTGKIFYRILLWADSLGKSWIRTESKRCDAIIRRWNFVEHSRVMKFEVRENFESDLLDKMMLGKDETNGRRIIRPESKGSVNILPKPTVGGVKPL